MNQEVFNSAFQYSDGMLYWKVKSGLRGIPGKRAGSISDKGYRIIRFNKKNYKEHRVIWIMLNGAIPYSLEVDHKDLSKDNNFIENLRLASHAQNQSNIKAYSNNRSGFKGVSYRKDISKWQAVIQHNNKQVHIGMFKDKEQAGIAYQEKAKQLHGEFANF